MRSLLHLDQPSPAWAISLKMADPNESSQFLLQPLNFDTSSSPAPSTGYDMAQSEISDGRWDEATSAASGYHGHTEATRGRDDERSTEARTEITGLLIRETGRDGNSSSAKNHQRSILRVWSLELSLLLLATGLLGSIFAILGAYNPDELPDWNGKTGVSITLNALIAVIATIFRATIAFVALEVLAQLKWDWITKTFRPVGDMQRYDDASRGALGSLMLPSSSCLQAPAAGHYSCDSRCCFSRHRTCHSTGNTAAVLRPGCSRAVGVNYCG
ncbi:hypothetical protein FNYG_01070 [Fusarium nygamai]|uniref:Uncharacterized protein n=1 Tax=Gibberella nygamai TaxID=42673 RepID=A0A2K0WUS7_GIBNY|nr:hypothetical protein FNYG_01070 [Fusarium nygamai]